MAVRVTETTNWDVLLESFDHESNGELPGILRLSETTQSVGNKRFEVLLNMHRSTYEQAATADNSDESQDAVILKILDIVCRQCVPNGRFLLVVDPSAEGEAAWELLDDVSAQSFIRDSLVAPTETGVGSFPSQPPPPVPHQGMARAASVNGPRFPPPPSKAATQNEEKKRRRRSSLLRRSVSESVVPADDKKKNMRRGSLSAFWKNLRNKKNGDSIEVPEPLDVLLESSLDAFEIGAVQVGNNRLRIMVEIQAETYKTADATKQAQMAQELVTTVGKHWGGRFLALLPMEKFKAYEILTASQAVTALQSIFASTSELESSEYKSMAFSPRTSMKRTGSDGEGSRVSTSTSTTAEKRPSAVKLEAVQALHSVKPPPITAEGPDHDITKMRSEAVKSLQKRKQRQGLASRLRNLTASTLRRTTSDPSNFSDKTQLPNRRGHSTGTQNLAHSDPSPGLHRFSTMPPVAPIVVPYNADLSRELAADLLALDVSGEMGMPFPEEDEEDVRREEGV